MACRYSGRSLFLLRRLLLAHRVVKAVGPAGLDQPLAAHKAQFAVSAVARHRAARRDDLVGTDPDRRDERAVRPDEGALADLGPIFEIAIIIAGDRARADIRVRADGDVAQIGEMVRLGPRAEHRLLRLDKIADLRL